MSKSGMIVEEAKMLVGQMKNNQDEVDIQVGHKDEVEIQVVDLLKISQHTVAHLTPTVIRPLYCKNLLEEA